MMRIGKYDITFEKKAAINALIFYALMITLFIFLTENNGKQSLLIAFWTSIIPFIWNTFWFNYYKNKKLNIEQNVEDVLS